MSTTAEVHDTSSLAQAPFVSLTTFKRDGTAVSTPVWCVGSNASLLVFTEADSWKVKRIRHDPHIRVATSTARGKQRGPSVEGDAAIEEDTTSVETLLAQKYGWQWTGYNFLMAAARRIRHRTPPESVTIKITLR